MLFAGSAVAQYGYDDYGYDSAGGYDVGAAGSGSDGLLGSAGDTVMDGSNTAVGTPAGDGGHRVGEALYCNGVRHPLEEERDDTGPARLMRLRELTRAVNVVGRALDPDRCGGSSEGDCVGLRKAVERAVFAAGELFQGAEQMEACLLDPERTWRDQEGSCQEMRQRMADLRRLDREALARAEYVLAARLCDGAGGLDALVRAACDGLRSALAQHGGSSRPAFWLDAPMPRGVQEAIRKVRLVTGGNFDVDALSSDLARDYRCEATGATGELSGMCNEYKLLARVSDACRTASVYIDERGEVHAEGGLDAEWGRAAATLCVDVSDFAPDSPLLVTVRLGAQGSRPLRVWPGEPIFIGHALSEPVSEGDVLGIEVRGKPRGISLAETLRVNGVRGDSPDACRIAGSYVPVVDHEIPIGGHEQRVIPMRFHAGRVGETGTVTQGDALVIWMQDIEPSGSVRVEYGDPGGPQYVGYIPPPLLGQTEELTLSEQRREAHRPPGASIRQGGVGIDQPLAPRRARYPGSRVLRLGFPAGFFEYPIRVCTWSGERQAGGSANAPALAAPITNCADARVNVVLSEKLYVHGEYYFGVRAGITGSWFPVQRLAARQTPDALRSGSNVWQVVAESDDVFDFDVSVLLAVYPLGRDPYRFDYRFWDFADGHYWDDVALLCGFGLMRSFTDPFADIYAGVSLPIYSGISLSVLAHFQKRSVPIGVHPGDMFEYADGDDPSVGSVYGTETQFITGVAFGLSMDWDLFERAILAIYNKFAPVPALQSSGSGYGNW
jgi:hypothetical protein